MSSKWTQKYIYNMSVSKKKFDFHLFFLFLFSLTNPNLYKFYRFQIGIPSYLMGNGRNEVVQLSQGLV